MKKFVSIFLAVCACFSASVMFAGCEEGHTHTYKTEWSKDATHHWHDCKSGDCSAVADKAEHAWDDGKITTQPSADADGVKTFTCVCGQTKTESVPYVAKTTVTKEEWETALQATKKGLFCYTMTMGERTGSIIYGENAIKSVNPNGVIEYYVKKDTGVFLYEYDDETAAWNEIPLVDNWEDTVSDYVEFALDDAGFYDLGFENFVFDDATQTYICERIEYVDSPDYIFDACFQFSNGKIEQVSWAFNDIDGTEMIWYNTISYAADDIVFTLPDFTISAPKTSVTQGEWEKAFLNAAETENLTYTWKQINVTGTVSSDDGFMKICKDGDKIFMDGGCGPNGESCYTYFEGDAIYHYTKDDQDVWSRTQVETLMHIPQLTDVVTPFADVYDAFVFDEETQTFHAESVEVMGIDMEVKVRIENGKLTYLNFQIYAGLCDNVPTWLISVYEFSEYGTTSVTLPNIKG